MSEKIRFWIPLALIITFLCSLIYFIGQQSLRNGANDPQIQMAEDIASVLANGKPPVERVPSTRVNVRKSLSVFSMVFDKTGRLIVSSGHIDGNSPVLPKEVLEYTKEHSQDRLTWEPVKTVRIAAVVTYYQGANEGYVLVGRSLREVEKRELLLLTHVGISWILTLIAAFIAILVFSPATKKKK